MKEQDQEKNIENLIQETISEIVGKMGFLAETEIKKSLKEESGEIIVCNIKTNDSKFLIGQYGANLSALQHLARVLIRKKTEEKVNFTVDVNSYRQEKNNSIIEMAREMAEQVIREKRAVVLRPMSSYERRIVHLELSGNAQIATESIGEGENRKVIIKPAEHI